MSMPVKAHAFSLSSILGSEVYAELESTTTESDSTENSQTMTLLEANVLSIPVLSGNDKKEDAIDETAVVDISADNALVPRVSPIVASDSLLLLDQSSLEDQTSVYVVRKGDSISTIAEMFGVSVNTIYWANDLKKGAKLNEGQILVILPFDGLKHTVKPKETLNGIAKLYKADVADILAFNGLAKEDSLVVGDELVIPDGQKTEESDKVVLSFNISNTYIKNLKSVDGYFIYPLPKGPRIRKTQGIHDKYAIDIGAPAGTPIYAAASGLVVIARTGYNGGYGTFVVVKHPNGTESRYAHMSKLGTSAGKQVSQGEIIGYVGTTGRSTGNHLHIEIRGARNPF
jgi:murein DD-endopeptidase MepM/ murein hydrolase activator NlpD